MFTFQIDPPAASILVTVSYKALQAITRVVFAFNISLGTMRVLTTLNCKCIPLFSALNKIFEEVLLIINIAKGKDGECARKDVLPQPSLKLSCPFVGSFFATKSLMHVQMLA